MNRLLIQFGLIGLAVLGLGGCGDFFAEKPTEMQSREVLRELTEVRESPNLQNPLPEVYRQSASRLRIKDGVKVFYFTRCHPAGDLASLLQQQLGVTSTINATTNQIVAYCKDDAQADTVQKYLEMIDVSPIQVNVDCLILERFGDITMDWETTLLVENLLGEKITLGEAKYPNPAFPGASLRESERANFGLDFGYWINQGVDGHQVRTVVDMLVSQGYLKILLNPKLETINGKQATVTIKDFAPIEEVKTGSAGASGVYNITKYVWVENTLSVTPQVYSDGSVGLTTSIKIGSRSKPEGVVQRSIITERAIDVDENRIERGKSLIIGGMRKSEKRSVVRGIPFFKDLPLLGVLFSSKDFEEKGTEIIFILTPSISSGGVENRDVVNEIRTKYAEPEYKKSLTDAVAGPFGRDAYTQVLEKKATDAELNRVQAELDLEQAEQEVRVESERANQAAAEAEALTKQVQQLQQQALQAQQAAEAAAAEAANTQQETEAEKEKARQLEAQKKQAMQAAEQARQAADQAVLKSQKASQNAQQLQQRTQEAENKLKKARQAVEEAKRKAAEEAKRQEEAKQKAAEQQEPSNSPPPETLAPPAPQPEQPASSSEPQPQEQPQEQPPSQPAP